MEETDLTYSDVLLHEYFLYDPVSMMFAGNVLSDSQPENSTNIPATGFFNVPKWNPDTKTWSDPINQTNKELISSLTEGFAQFQITQMQIISNLTQKIADLEAKAGN